LHNFFPLLFYLINLICLSISIIVCLNKKNILIKKFSKHNKVNISFSRLNILIYTCLLNFQILFLVIINDFLFIYLFTYVARVQHRGDRPPHSYMYLENMGRQGILVFY